MNTFKPCPFCEAAQSENERLRDTNKALERDLFNAEMNLQHITAEFAESQAEIKRGLLTRKELTPNETQNRRN